MLEHSLLLIFGLIFLIKGADILVEGARNVAERLHIPSTVIGLTIVAFGTSAPELFISVQSALKGSSDMAIGNVIGSNICNLALVLGVTCMIASVAIKDEIIKLDWPVTMGSSVLLFLLVMEGGLQRNEGILLLLVLFCYIYILVMRSQKNARLKRKLEQEAKELDTVVDSGNPKKSWKKSLWASTLFIILGGAGLYFGSDWFVGAAKEIFLELGFSERLIGIVVFAVGTSLPELVTSIASALKKDTEMAVGGLLGSNIFNIFSILGITSIIRTIQVSETIRNYDLIWMLGITLIIFPLMYFGRKMKWMHGVLLLTLYVVYNLTLFLA